MGLRHFRQNRRRDQSNGVPLTRFSRSTCRAPSRRVSTEMRSTRRRELSPTKAAIWATTPRRKYNFSPVSISATKTTTTTMTTKRTLTFCPLAISKRDARAAINSPVPLAPFVIYLLRNYPLVAAIINRTGRASA